MKNIKNMKRYNLNGKGIMGLLLALIIGLASCSDFLTQDPKTALTQEEVYGNLDNLEPMLMGLYTKWRDTRKDRGGFMFTLGTDEGKQGAYQVRTEEDQAGLDKYNGFLSPSNSALTQQWDARWLVVSAAAQAVYALESNKQDPARKQLLMGEACFIRAALNFELVQYWGEIPVIDLDKVNEYGTARQSLTIVYGAIIADLEKAIEYLPVVQSDKRRATQGAAQALLGKVYLYARAESGIRDYAKAITYFEKVMANQAGYHLVSTYGDLFDPAKANSSEAIYEFQFNNIWPDNNQTQWQMGSRSLANLDQYCYYGGYDLMLPTEYCAKNVSEGGLWEDGDVRKSASIRYDFVYYGQQPQILAGFGGDELDPHVKKYEDPRTDGKLSFWYSGKNIIYLRLADILLCYAECLNETGETGKAVDIVNNQIRTRAWGGTLPADKRWDNGLSQQDFRDKMMDERMRELCFEGWRRMDLIRTGNLVKLVKARNKWAKESGTIQEFHNRYPIPLIEIKQNEDINPEDQNPGYVN
jgi:starch-binding outer membrane protein, SusD/RagB family